jgi:hypothetical protein
MPLPSLFKSSQSGHAWSVIHAAGYGALVGALAALFKTFGPLQAGGGKLTDHLIEIGAAAVAFALLCAAAAMLRNFIARRLIWHEGR